MLSRLHLVITELFFLRHVGTLFLKEQVLDRWTGVDSAHFFLILGFFDGGFVGQINVPKKCNSIGKKNSILNWNDAEINQLWYCPNFPISKKSRYINLL